MDARTPIKKLEQALGSGKVKKIDLADFMNTCQALFEEGGGCLEVGSAREKDDLLKDLLALQQALEKDVESLAKESGNTLEQMTSYIENPDNFPQDIWQTIQKTWRRIVTIKTKKKSKNASSEKGNTGLSWMKPTP